MIIDALWNFTGATTGIGNSDGKTDSPTTGTQASSNVIDLGVGTVANPQIPSFANGGGARDVGVGYPLKVLLNVTAAFTNGTSLQVLLQGAPDDGSGGIGSYTTMYTGPVVAEADLDIGARLADIDIPRPVPGQPLPRFLRLSFVTVGTHTLGSVWGTVVLDRMDQPEQSNAVMGGYPAGLTVAN